MKPRLRYLAIGAAALAVVPLAACSSSGSSSASGGASGGTATTAGNNFTIGIIEQQLSNPFFATLESAAKAEAAKQGVKVITAEAQSAGDSATQITAIEDMINRNVKGIVIDPANATAVVPAIAQARAKGIVVVAVNTQTSPVSAVDATIETDNLQAGKLTGQWAKGTVGSNPPHIALLDYPLTDLTSMQRHNGYLAGWGITGNSPEIVGTALTQSDVNTGQSGMENLLSAHPNINAVYSINEPVAEGAAAAIKAKNLTNQIALTGIDGSCTGVKAVQAGQIGATVLQFPKKMGQMAVDDIVTFAHTGTKPTGITNSGTTLVTAKPVAGVPSQNVAYGLQNCWG